MFGASVYLSGFDGQQPLWDEADIYFTSLHIAEEFSETYGERAKALLNTLRESGKKIIVDISPRGVKMLGYSNLRQFAEETGADVVRCDYGFSEKEMEEAAGSAVLCFNASSGSFDLAGKLKAKGLEVCAIHNFYPRPETGLDEEYFENRNKILRELGIRTAAFLSGDGLRRGPLEEGLPTLECHRNLPPYVQYLQLKEKYGMDLVLAGDPGVSKAQRKLISETEKDGVIRIPACLDGRYRELYDRTWTIREDSPRWTARLEESRGYASQGRKLPAENCLERTPGSITVDNEKYLRYSGEIQVVKETLPACDRVNVIGAVDEAYTGLLELLRGGKKLRFVEKEKLVCSDF